MTMSNDKLLSLGMNIPESVQNNIATILERTDRGIPMLDFPELYEKEFGCALTPSKYGCHSADDFWTYLAKGEICLIIDENDKKYLFAMPESCRKKIGKEKILPDLFLIHKHRDRSHFPVGFLTPHDQLKYLNWSNIIKPGVELDVVVSDLNAVGGALIDFKFHLKDHHDDVEEITRQLNEFYGSMKGDELVIPDWASVSGMFCVAKYENDFNRVEIDRHRPLCVRRVYYVDHGGYRRKKPCNLYYLKNEFAKTPMMAISGTLFESEKYVWTYATVVERLKEQLYFGLEDDIKATVIDCDISRNHVTASLTLNGQDVLQLLYSSGLIEKRPELTKISSRQNPTPPHHHTKNSEASPSDLMDTKYMQSNEVAKWIQNSMSDHSQYDTVSPPVLTLPPPSLPAVSESPPVSMSFGATSLPLLEFNGEPPFPKDSSPWIQSSISDPSRYAKVSPPVLTLPPPLPDHSESLPVAMSDGAPSAVQANPPLVNGAPFIPKNAPPWIQNSISDPSRYATVAPPVFTLPPPLGELSESTRGSMSGGAPSAVQTIFRPPPGFSSSPILPRSMSFSNPSKLSPTAPPFHFSRPTPKGHDLHALSSLNSSLVSVNPMSSDSGSSPPSYATFPDPSMKLSTMASPVTLLPAPHVCSEPKEGKATNCHEDSVHSPISSCSQTTPSASLESYKTSASKFPPIPLPFKTAPTKSPSPGLAESRPPRENQTPSSNRSATFASTSSGVPPPVYTSKPSSMCYVQGQMPPPGYFQGAPYSVQGPHFPLVHQNIQQRFWPVAPVPYSPAPWSCGTWGPHNWMPYPMPMSYPNNAWVPPFYQNMMHPMCPPGYGIVPNRGQAPMGPMYCNNSHQQFAPQHFYGPPVPENWYMPPETKLPTYETDYSDPKMFQSSMGSQPNAEEFRPDVGSNNLPMAGDPLCCGEKKISDSVPDCLGHSLGNLSLQKPKDSPQPPKEDFWATKWGNHVISLAGKTLPYVMIAKDPYFFIKDIDSAFPPPPDLGDVQIDAEECLVEKEFPLDLSPELKNKMIGMKLINSSAQTVKIVHGYHLLRYLYIRKRLDSKELARVGNDLWEKFEKSREELSVPQNLSHKCHQFAAPSEGR